ncbi:MAG: CAP domain-containing protein [Lachnospiraceae bacterium]|nr:CAP domain-containing protein [Lachnospiraceae bacterium]
MNKKMKATVIVLVVALLAGLFAIPPKVQADEDLITINQKVTYRMTEARKMLELMNDARREANHENLDGISNRCDLTLDRSLEDTAKIRAAEITISFSHTRLDGSRCFTAFTPQGNCAENIAMGNATAEKTHMQFYNERENYMTQNGKVTGHYTNMIDPRLSTVGIACAQSDSSRWRYYWVVDFGSKSSGGELEPETGQVETVALKASKSYLSSQNIDVTKYNTSPYAGTTTEAATTTQAAKPADIYKMLLGRPSISVKAKAKKKLEVKVKDISVLATGYQVRISLNKNMKSAKTKKVKKISTKKVIFKGLKKNKRYYVQMRAYMKYDGSKAIYGDWSKKKSVKIKK